jgi:hypothetical protein
MFRRGCIFATTTVSLGFIAGVFADDPSPALEAPKPASTPAVTPHATPEKIRRQTIPIAKQWNLTAEKHDRAEMDGKRTKLLVSTGHVTLKHGANIVRGPWDIDARAERVEADFVRKKFVLHGSPYVATKDPKTGAILKAMTGAADAVIEIGIDDPKIEITAGEVKTESTTPAPAGGS